jgi:AraC-like DNA-binding protein
MVTLDQAGWRRSTLVISPPPPMLEGVIDFLWVDERPRLSPRSHEWRIVADDAAHVIYARFTDGRTGTETHRLHVVGARPQYADIDCRHRLLTVGARLRPGAIPALLGLPGNEVTDRSVPAEWIVRQQAREVLSQLESGAPDQATAHVAAFIAALALRGRPIDERARWLAGVDARAAGAVGQIASEMGFGDRALRAWSATHLGIGLKRFLNIRRLHRAVESRLRSPATTWSQVAAAAGFADQPHLVRDCRAFLGESPTEFLARAG